MSVTHSRTALAAYGVLRMPLALLELPLYVLLPSFYSGSLGLELATIGAVLFGARLLDALADPLIGATIDRWRGRFDDRRWIWAALPVLAIGFAAMFTPPVSGSSALAAWLALTSMVTYLAYSAVSIAHQSWGASIGTTTVERARVTATREAFGLFGVVGASALLSPKGVPLLVALFAGLATLAAIAATRAPPPRPAAPAAGPAAPQPGNPRALGLQAAWRDVAGNRSFRWLLAAFMLNGIATAMPATLVLFFVRDVLGGGDRAIAVFLTSYFLAGALGMPLWLQVARRFGLRNAWLLGIAFAVLAFAWALGLGRDDMIPFLAVCVLTGLALGSDLSMPAALLSAVISDAGHDGRREGSYFGVWNLATKLNLALAAGVALPSLALLGYTPGEGAGGTLALSLAYAALPCALKLAAGAILLVAPLPDASPGVTPVREPA